MSYLGLDLDNLCWEIKSLMQNNYGEEVTKKNFNKLFTHAKNDILERFRDIINQNKEDVLNDFKEHLETEEDEEERFCVKCGKSSDLLEDEDMCYTCAKERGRV